MINFCEHANSRMNKLRGGGGDGEKNGSNTSSSIDMPLRFGFAVSVCARGYRKLYDVDGDGDDESKFIKVILLIEYITLG